MGDANLAALPADSVYEYFGVAVPMSHPDRYWLVLSLAGLGRFAEAAPDAAEALRLAQPTHHAYTIGQTCSVASWLHISTGDFAKARSLTEHGIAVLRTGNVVKLLPWAVALSALVLARVGEADEALIRLREGEQFVEPHAARGSVGILGAVYSSLGRAGLLLGRLEEARSLGARAVQYSASFLGSAASGLHLLGDIATHPDQFDAESTRSLRPSSPRPITAGARSPSEQLARRDQRPRLVHKLAC